LKRNKPRVKWDVYGQDRDGLSIFLGQTWAISEKQACNQVRRREFGERPYADIPLAFFAVSVKTVKEYQQQQQFLF